MFRSATYQLVDYSGGEQNWPKYALLTHAIELALKAFVRHSTNNVQLSTQPKNHDLSGWYKLAVQYGLPHNAPMEESIAIVNELHVDHFARYPQSRSIPVSDVMMIAESTTDHLIDTFTKAINPQR